MHCHFDHNWLALTSEQLSRRGINYYHWNTSLTWKLSKLREYNTLFYFYSLSLMSCRQRLRPLRISIYLAALLPPELVVSDLESPGLSCRIIGVVYSSV